MDERHEELAALNALGMLESDEKRVLEGTCLVDKELRDLTAELEGVAAELAWLVPPAAPPATMKKRIRERIRARGGPARFSLSKAALAATAGWTLAAVLAGSSFWLWKERARLENDLASASKILAAVAPPKPAQEADKKVEPVRSLEDELKKLHADFDAKTEALKKEIESLRKREADGQTKITQLTAEAEAVKKKNAEAKMDVLVFPPSTVWEYRRGIMTVVWDKSRDQGVVIMDKMPKVESGKDYQLWVIDADKPAPISAGVVQVDSKGTAKQSFKPTEEVGENVKFSLSVEPKGGSPTRSGEVLLEGP